MSYSIGFIGGGNMASAIINGLLKNNIYQASEIIVSVARKESILRVEEQLGAHATVDNNEVIKSCDLIVLAVKPHLMMAILNEIKSNISEKHVFISIAAGITLEQLKNAIGDNKLFRVMPNTPAAVGLAMSSICSTIYQDDSDFKHVVKIFDAIGKTAIIDESLFHAAIAVHGSSPAYVYMMIEAMSDAAVLQGMPRDKAYTMAAQSVLGAAQMVLSTGLHPGVLKDQVTSPGGTTIEAVAGLEQGGFRSSIINAMNKCAEKSAEMSRRSK